MFQVLGTLSESRHFLAMVRRLSSMVGELSRPGTRELEEVSEVSSSGSGNLVLERLGRMNRRTCTEVTTCVNKMFCQQTIVAKVAFLRN